jgi:Cytochrome c
MRSIVFGLVMISSLPALAGEPTGAERGKKALLENSFIPPAWRQSGFDNVWKRWEGVKEKPADLQKALCERYGLHPAPYPNNGLPMGLRKASFLLIQGVSVDCMLCHGGSIMGKSYVGLGNSSLEIQALFEEMSGADGRRPATPFVFGNVRGTSEAGGMAVYLLGYRDPDLSMHAPRRELGLHDDMCEDVPAWWLLKKKKTMYFTGGADAHSVRSKMQFMMTPLTSRADFDKHEAAFQDIEAYLRTIEAPKYPFPIDRTLAAAGESQFLKTCSSCHGTYGDKPTYPNKIVAIDEIGTDRKRYEGVTDEFAEYYNQSWFAKEKGDGYQALPSNGYQAPPLDGIWATAPYLHNGSAPTVYHVLNSMARPAIFTRSYKTAEVDYDKVKLGWKFTELTKPPPEPLTPIERRKIYDTKQPGRGNGGHTFGDHLTDDERMAVIEYLKTL